MDVGCSQWWFTASTMTPQCHVGSAFPKYSKFVSHLHRYNSVRLHCSRPFSQPKDAAQQQGVLKLSQEKFMSGGGKKGLLGALKMDFMRLGNVLTLMIISVEISTEIIY
jgi:hypothetical protein